MAVKRILLIAILMLIPALARADSVWNYQGTTGDPFYTSNHGPAIDGTVDFASLPVFGETSPPAVLSFSFTQGSYSFNQTNSTLSIQPFSWTISGDETPYNQPFFLWAFLIFQNGQPVVVDLKTYDVGESSAYGPAGSEQGGPGVWTEVASTPEPSSLVSLLAGLLGLTTLAALRK